MSTIVIEGIPPYDGEYDFDLEKRMLSGHELGWVKKIAGYKLGEIEQGDGDAVLALVFAAIAVTRAGKARMADMQETYDKLADPPFGEMVQVRDEDEGGGRGRPFSRRKLEQEWRYFLARFEAEFGDFGESPPESLWDARLGYFGIRPAEVGDLTPAQLLGCVELFSDMYGGE